MRKIFITIIIAAAAVLSTSQRLSAVRAYPGPITVTQPDGTSIVIRVHGDEFLNWITCGNSLVVLGDDGFYHYASFDADGVSRASGARVTSTPMGDGSSVRPPMVAIEKAKRERKQRDMMSKPIRKAAGKDGTVTVTGEKHYLVMLIEFNDLPFTISQPQTAFGNMLNQEGYPEYGSTGSARDYFRAQSSDQFKPVFDVYGPYKVNGYMKSYSTNDGLTQNGAPRLLAEACTIADSEIDFSKYDLDGDGMIDNVYFYYAGHNSAEGVSGTIWPHSWAVMYDDFTFDGVHLFGYACSSEYKGASGYVMTGIGTFCHEYSHTLGLPDFYDTDYEEQGEGYGLGEYSLMSDGNYNNDGRTPPYFNCEERRILGWMSKTPSMPSKSADLTLSPVHENAGYTSATGNDGEYFLYEFRDGKGWDEPLSPGLVIYHIDKSRNMVNGETAAERWESGMGINDVAAHECFKLMFADAKSKIIPFGGSYDKFTSSSTSQARSWSGAVTGYDLTYISFDSDKASFHLTNTNADQFYKLGICAIETYGDWKAGDEFPLKLVETAIQPTSVVWYFDGNRISSGSVILTAGTHSVKAVISWSNGDSGAYTANLDIK